ncbi:unnamed protein product [Albugo candida]|uniref:non-specific serine/threonine protein kinase n=1 Tax=Albugo candida TaxID=65357 RepID=A0A024FZX9_9STRA|nr:unnamed protein product [Albugo candida]|eukprot:CCI39937.1 unnamed protein product [Albugo candida]
MDPSEVCVLVVEDDEFTRMATIDILRSCRYEVFAVENGKEALNALMQEPTKYDLVLCDVMLPVMNGIQLLAAMMERNGIASSHSVALHHIPVVMTSSNEEMDVVTNCLSKGAKDYLIKPIQVNTAKTLVRHVWLSQQQDQQRAFPPSQFSSFSQNQHLASGNTFHTNANKSKLNASLWQDLEMIRNIGKGTHGNVVLAKRRVDGAIVAVKRVQTSQISESGKKQADNEVVLLQSLYHVNIVRFYDHFMIGDELNIVMEYSDGGNLRQLVKMRSREKMGPFPEAVIMSWFAQLVLAVAYIHGKNVLHRDLKAQNVFLTRKNVVKLGDFGISKALAGDVTANTACGTPESMSPEICRGEPYGKKSDVWSLGCILYEMIMLRRPFEAKTLPDIFTKICIGEYPAIPQNVCSRELRLLVQLMLQLDASKRPTIEDICRFPFVQGPIQAFLSEHVAEFQEALELEAKLHQPSLYTARNTVMSPVSPSLRRKGTLDDSIPFHSPKLDRSISPSSNRLIKDPSPTSLLNKRSSYQHLIQSASSPSEQVRGKLRDSAIAAVAAGLIDTAHPSKPHEKTSMDSISAHEESDAIKSTPVSGTEDTLADALRSKVDIQNIRPGFFTTYTACVSGFDVCYALQRHFSKSEKEAYDMVERLVQNKTLNMVMADSTKCPKWDSPTTYLRFQVDESFVPLNKKFIASELSSVHPMELCIKVREAIALLHADALFPDGIHTGFSTCQGYAIDQNVKSDDVFSNSQGYTEARASVFHAPIAKQYRSFLRLVAKFQQVDLKQLAKHDRQAFFINVYNTMVLHGFIEFGVPQNSGQYRAFEKDVQYVFGEFRFTLGDIKHGIIRCNRKPPSNYWDRQLQPQDSRLQFRLHIRDPRSLLVLIDMCEPIPCADDVAIIRSGRTDTDLEEQVEKFCNRHVFIHEDIQEVELPRLFRVFRDDFGAAECDMISWLLQYFHNPPAHLITFRVRYCSGISC